MRKLLLLLLATTLAFCSKPSDDAASEPNNSQNFFQANRGDWTGNVTREGLTTDIALEIGEDGTEWFVDVYIANGSCYTYASSIYDNYSNTDFGSNTANRLVINKQGAVFTYTRSGSTISIHEVEASGIVSTGSISKRVFNECN